MLSNKVLTVAIVAFVITALSCERPDVPVACTRRKSLVGQGDVVRIRNKTEKLLALWIEANGKTVQFTLQPHEVKEFGWLEGFAFGENSTYRIGGEGYASVAFSTDNEGPRED
jgi:hypothetical protein